MSLSRIYTRFEDLYVGRFLLKTVNMEFTYILKRKLTRTVFSLELGSTVIKVRTLSGLPSIKVNVNVNLPMCTSVKRIHKHVHFC